MHKQLAAKIVINAKLRLTEGDCLVTQQVGPELLEECILELARMNQELVADLNRYKTDDRLEPKPTYEQLEARVAALEADSQDATTPLMILMVLMNVWIWLLVYKCLDTAAIM